jgi:hypothetical protein
MKRYWLFYYDAYYPLGGMDDFIESFDSLEEAIDYSKNLEISPSDSYYQVFDSHINEIVSHGKYANGKARRIIN